MAQMMHRLRSSPLAVLGLLVLVVSLIVIAPLAYRAWAERGDPDHREEAHESEQGDEVHEEDVIELDEDARRLGEIETAAVSRRPLREYVGAPGVLHANLNETATVSPSVAGTVESVSVSVGDEVRRGQALVNLRCPELAAAQANVATARAELVAAEEALDRRKALADEGEFASAPYEQARRAYDEAEQNMRLAESSLERVRRLAELGAPSRPAAEEAAKELSAAREAVRTAETDLASARASLDTASRVAARLGAEARDGRVGSAERTAAQAKLTEAETALRAARVDTQRLENLLPDGLATEQQVAASRVEGAKAEAEVEAAKLALRVVDTPLDEARLSVSTAEQQVAQAETALAEARERLKVAEAQARRETTVADEEIPSRQQVAEAEKELQVARAAFAQARAAWEREQALHKRGLRTREALADLETDVATARARLRATERTVSVLGRGRQRAGGRLALIAAASGKIGSRTARVGAMVDAGAALLEIVGVRTIWVEAAFYEKDVPLLAVGQAMDVKLTAFPGQTFETTIHAIDPGLDEHTRKATVRGLLDNPGGKLLPDMFAAVRVAVGTNASALAVPADAVAVEGRERFVFIEEEPGHYARRDVTTGLHIDDFIEIVDGLAEGETIVTSGVFLLKSELRKSELKHEH